MTRLEQKIGNWIQSWKGKGYLDGIPDEAPPLLEESGRVPSYRLICKALLRNDKNLMTLGFGRPPCDLYMQIKREELRAKGKKVWQAHQTKMF